MLLLDLDGLLHLRQYKHPNSILKHIDIVSKKSTRLIKPQPYIDYLNSCFELTFIPEQVK